MRMTQRQVKCALQNIGLRNYNDIALNARMKGHKINLKDHSYFKAKSPGTNKAFTKKETDALEKHMEQVLARKGMKPRNGNRTGRKT